MSGNDLVVIQFMDDLDKIYPIAEWTNEDPSLIRITADEERMINTPHFLEINFRSDGDELLLSWAHAAILIEAGLSVAQPNPSVVSIGGFPSYVCNHKIYEVIASKGRIIISTAS